MQSKRRPRSEPVDENKKPASKAGQIAGLIGGVVVGGACIAAASFFTGGVALFVLALAGSLIGVGGMFSGSNVGAKKGVIKGFFTGISSSLLFAAAGIASIVFQTNFFSSDMFRNMSGDNDQHKRNDDQDKRKEKFIPEGGSQKGKDAGFFGALLTGFAIISVIAVSVFTGGIPVALGVLGVLCGLVVSGIGLKLRTEIGAKHGPVAGFFAGLGSIATAAFFTVADCFFPKKEKDLNSRRSRDAQIPESKYDDSHPNRNHKESRSPRGTTATLPFKSVAQTDPIANHDRGVKTAIKGSKKDTFVQALTRFRREQPGEWPKITAPESLVETWKEAMREVFQGSPNLEEEIQKSIKIKEKPPVRAHENTADAPQKAPTPR